MNTITIELCAEDRARLDAILNALTSAQNQPVAPEKANTPATTQAEPKKATTPEPTATETKKKLVLEPADDDIAEAMEDAFKEKTVKLEDIQALVIDLARNGKKEEAKAIVTAYAERVTLIPVDKYAEVFKKLKAIGG